MNAFAESILSTPVLEVIGTEISYLSPKTKRKRIGDIVSVSGSGTKVLNRDGVHEFVTFRDFTGIKTPSKTQR
jgi:hypothetical protein